MTTKNRRRLLRLGGMGVNISCPRLARAVAMLGQYGTVSGVALERVMAYILQCGDPDGSIRRALSHFPFPDVAQKVLTAYFERDGVKLAQFRAPPPFTTKPSDLLIALTICANFAFVWLAKEGHNGYIAINYLTKIALPLPYAITGAMLANVDCITMGAGIALQDPKVISALLEGRPIHYDVPVLGQSGDKFVMSFDPAAFFGCVLPEMKRPDFVPIISADGLADVFCSNRCSGPVDGFVVEHFTAPGHKAPPRTHGGQDAEGKVVKVYGKKDEPNFTKIASHGLPFWIGGNQASPEKLAAALKNGASGIQVGSIFALCEESGLRPDLRSQLRALGYQNALRTKTEMRVSPTGFPFAVAQLGGTLSDSAVYAARHRACEHGVLVQLYRDPKGNIGRRCPAEPKAAYTAKGGPEADTEGRVCLCDALLASAGANLLGRPPIITLGNVDFLPHLMASPDASYTAEDAVNWLLSQQEEPTP